MKMKPRNTVGFSYDMKQMHASTGTSRQGMAIVIALFFAFSLLILFFGMYTMNRNVTSHNRLSLQNQQAFFAARAALQHLLLKAKLFPTELYDAVEFSQGKNPLFDFTEYPLTCDGQTAFEPFPTQPTLFQRVKPSTELGMNGQPKFFYINFQDRQDVFVRIGNYFNPEFRFLAPNSVRSSPMSQKYTHPDISAFASTNPDKFLKYFIRDCTNGQVDSKILQPVLVMNKAANLKTAKDFKIADEGLPYTMSYAVEEIKVGSLKDLRRYNEEAIEMRVVGSIEDFQGKKFTQVQTKIQKITRKGALD
ncbi:MAG: hypothetical protein WA705_19920 [Candidatus Ozemobacteraceae bacterium]